MYFIDVSGSLHTGKMTLKPWISSSWKRTWSHAALINICWMNPYSGIYLIKSYLAIAFKNFKVKVFIWFFCSLITEVFIKAHLAELSWLCCGPRFHCSYKESSQSWEEWTVVSIQPHTVCSLSFHLTFAFIWKFFYLIGQLSQFTLIVKLMFGLDSFI